MKIAIRGGHNYQVQGANALLNEVTEDRKIYIKVVEYLKQMGHEILDVTPNRTNTSASDLIYGVTKANNWGAEYFCSIHLNAGGGIGAECLYQSTKGKEVAERIAAKVATLGFRDRGAKSNTRNLYELKYTNMVANIVECFFLDSKADVELYNKVGVDAIAKAIAEGISGKSVNSVSEYPGFIVKNGSSGEIVKRVQERLNNLGFYCGIADGIAGNMTHNAIVAFQRTRGLSVDGLVGPTTWNKLFN